MSSSNNRAQDRSLFNEAGEILLRPDVYQPPADQQLPFRSGNMMSRESAASPQVFAATSPAAGDKRRRAPSTSTESRKRKQQALHEDIKAANTHHPVEDSSADDNSALGKRSLQAQIEVSDLFFNRYLGLSARKEPEEKGEDGEDSEEVELTEEEKKQKQFLRANMRFVYDKEEEMDEKLMDMQMRMFAESRERAKGGEEEGYEGDTEKGFK